MDSYASPPPYDRALEQPTDLYLASYACCGVNYLAGSWRHYLPQLIAYSLRHVAEPNTLAIDRLLASLRPPDHVPPRLATLDAELEAVIVAFLGQLAFSDDAVAYHDIAMQILDEWWLP